MLFIFGISPKTVKTDQGQFVCPICKTRSAYEIKTQRNYFSLFFIKLFPVSKPRESAVVCLNCGTHMPKMVLDH
ncbi:zinc-ribbon domain-containing protein [Acinetobacter defluvii]|uniref:Zinc-ribbon domain-containing protein n=1 Tax=Acinetobacter defluvii TaxID=1871111 RepID=A0A2S2FA66_9GAMM|nr:zinc-ribbon domain-containing protein [Acinetobacter defluvii]AWL27854.1 zinc-ribbon domain-containing protein [Acinetobacter defluvii]NNP71909.1 zinc-ribbon domain-containing protein [Acinetobacter defluvii]